ncbi:MAG: YfhO family protein, partial [Acidobacteria bacterium]|nr:YfhO family protein [Acidobacteriota bacterium]
APLLVLFALFAKQGNKLVWFWTVVAGFSLLMAFGKYLPFGLNLALYQTPWAAFFRAPSNHLYELTFGVSILAGLGLSFLERMDHEKVKRTLSHSSIVFILIVALAVIYYRFKGNLIAAESPNDKPNLLTGFETLTTISLAIVSLVALWLSARRRNLLCASLLITILFADLAVFGLFVIWGRLESRVEVNARSQDPPSVRFIKSRESDLNSFRIISQSITPDGTPDGKSSDNLNLPNLSIARGLRSVNGVDEMRSSRSMAIAGEMGADGLVTDLNIFNPDQQGLNLFNVKYLLLEGRDKVDQKPTIEIGGVRFNEEKIYINLTRGSHLEIPAQGIMASELALVTTMADSVTTDDDTPVVQLKFHTKGGRVLEQEIRAGRDTGEWCYDSEDIRPHMKHRRPPIAESSSAGAFSAHQYLARVAFDRAEVQRIEFDYLLPHANLMISRISLHDLAPNVSSPISSIDLVTGLWRELAQFENVAVYENPNYAPRAWFVKRAVVAPSVDVLQSIKNGTLPDGNPFNPSETVLFDREDFGGREISDLAIGDPVNSTVKVSRYEPNRIEIQTSNAQPGFLVLSEIYFRGWDAWVDGRRTPVERVNHALRGIAVPAGEHQVDFVFRPPALWNGAFYTFLGLLILFAGAVISRFGADRLQSTVKSWIPSGVRIPSRAWDLKKLSRVKSLFPSRARTLIASKSLTLIAILGLTFYGYLIFSRGCYVIAGSDTPGYAILAQRILQNRIVQPITELDEFNLSTAYSQIFLPLAFLPGKNRNETVPLYPIGLPLHMLIAALIFGWNIGPCLIGPFTTVM